MTNCAIDVKDAKVPDRGKIADHAARHRLQSDAEPGLVTYERSGMDGRNWDQAQLLKLPRIARARIAMIVADADQKTFACTCIFRNCLLIVEHDTVPRSSNPLG